jgi:hypothetical protein
MYHLDPEDGADNFLQNVGLNGTISLKTASFVTTAARTSNPTRLPSFLTNGTFKTGIAV